MGAKGSRAKTRPPTSGRSGSDTRRPPDLQGFRHWHRLRWIAFFHALCGLGRVTGQTIVWGEERFTTEHTEKQERRRNIGRGAVGWPPALVCLLVASSSHFFLPVFTLDDAPQTPCQHRVEACHRGRLVWAQSHNEASCGVGSLRRTGAPLAFPLMCV